MNQDISTQLRRLGLGKGPASLKPPEQRRSGRKVESLIPGRVIAADEGACFVAENRYPISHVHGKRPLGGLLGTSPRIAARLAQEPALAQCSIRDLLFLDTETTGLSGGAGTLVFLVGIGFFEGDYFLIRQYFLRTPGDEPAMLTHLAAEARLRPGVVTFNGRSFDLPLLETRYILNRRMPPFLNAPHLDLLPPSRRLWRDALDSCRLSSLEDNVLGVQRDQNDIPGGEIPLIYRDYLFTGNGVEMPRIFYHNQVDVLSLVGLTERLCRSFDEPDRVLERGQEWLSLGRWYQQMGMSDRAESAYRRAIRSSLPEKRFEAALLYLAGLLKRSDRRDEAAVVWQQLAAVETGDVQGHVELAKHHEWNTGDLGQAADWTRRALRLVDRWPRTAQRPIWEELSHRLARLERKLGDTRGPEVSSGR